MGVDIHMNIYKNQELIAEDIFDGRNSNWFRNLQLDRGDDLIYSHLAIHYGVAGQVPLDYKDKFDFDYWGFYWFTVKDFKEWFLKYRPDVDAGWVTRYEAWAYKHKSIAPDYLRKELNKDDVIEDMRFIKVANIYDCSAWLYQYLIEHDIPDDAVVQYCFDS